MPYDLRPLSFVEILDRSFRLLRDHFVTVVGAMAAFFVPYGLMMSVVARKSEPDAVPRLDAMFLIALGVGLLFMAIFLPLAQLATTRITADAYLGESTGIADGLRASRKLYLPYVGTFSLMVAALFGLMFLLVIPAVYFAVCWTMTGPVVVVERMFGRAALKRSRWLVRDHWGRTAGLFFVASLLNSVVAGGVNMVVGAVPVFGPVLVGLVQATGAAYVTIVIIVLYIDLRCRKEDFDLAVLAQQVERAGSPELSVGSSAASGL
jgi:hypothetical protein